MAKYGQGGVEEVESAMRRRKKGSLKSGSGRKVKSRKQAIAIGLSEAREKGAKVPKPADPRQAINRPQVREVAELQARLRSFTPRDAARVRTDGVRRQALRGGLRRSPGGWKRRPGDFRPASRASTLPSRPLQGSRAGAPRGPRPSCSARAWSSELAPPRPRPWPRSPSSGPPRSRRVLRPDPSSLGHTLNQLPRPGPAPGPRASVRRRLRQLDQVLMEAQRRHNQAAVDGEQPRQMLALAHDVLRDAGAAALLQRVREERVRVLGALGRQGEIRRVPVARVDVADAARMRGCRCCGCARSRRS